MANLKQLEIEIRSALSKARMKPFEAEVHLANALAYLEDVNNWIAVDIAPYSESSTFGDKAAITPMDIIIKEKHNWIKFVGNEQLFGEASLNNCLCKFDNGMEVRYNDFHPMAILTHFELSVPQCADMTQQLLHDIISWEKNMSNNENLSQHISLETILRERYVIHKRV